MLDLQVGDDQFPGLSQLPFGFDFDCYIFQVGPTATRESSLNCLSDFLSIGTT